MALMLAIWRPHPNWMPKKPKLMFQICQKLSRGLCMGVDIQRIFVLEITSSGHVKVCHRHGYSNSLFYVSEHIVCGAALCCLRFSSERTDGCQRFGGLLGSGGCGGAREIAALSSHSRGQSGGTDPRQRLPQAKDVSHLGTV